MTDYDDQNSSEYKDQTTETAPAEQTGQQISSPADGQDTNQQSPDNRQMPPQNNGQDPYWQNPNNQQIPPQNNGQNPYWDLLVVWVLPVRILTCALDRKSVV